MSDDSPDQAPRHPIRVAAGRTGLSPDVLRAWERRHGVVTPARSEAGQRLYSDADVDRLSLLAMATRSGRPLGRTATLPLEELRRLVAEDAERGASRSTPASEFLERAFAAASDLDPERLQTVLRGAVLSLGAPGFLDEVVAPLLRRIGTAWHAGEIGIAHEHAASVVVRRVLGWLVEFVEVPDDAPRAVVACLAHEHHELGAALATATAAHAGWRVIYLGPDLPAAEIAAAALRQKADVVGVSIVAPGDVAAARSELQALRKDLGPRTLLLAGGGGVPSLGALGDGITPVRDLTHWRAILRAHARAA
jgi:methylmalonyl-CoA mutase cobalamin-binding subunit/DNA-binding transcriptional MerR regulator